MYRNGWLQQLTKLPATTQPGECAALRRWLFSPLSLLTVAPSSRVLLMSRVERPVKRRRKTIPTGRNIAMKAYFPFVLCEQCYPATVILLPYSGLPESLLGHPAWCGSDWKCNVACLKCSVTTEYSAQQLRWGTFDGAFIDRLQSALFAIDIQCGEKRCKSPIRIHFWADSSTSANEARIKICTGDFWTIRCSAGHYAKDLRPLAPVFQVARPIWPQENERYQPSRLVELASTASRA